jgi:hypothetical protein
MMLPKEFQAASFSPDWYNNLPSIQEVADVCLKDAHKKLKRHASDKGVDDKVCLSLPHKHPGLELDKDQLAIGKAEDGQIVIEYRSPSKDELEYLVPFQFIMMYPQQSAAAAAAETTAATTVAASTSTAEATEKTSTTEPYTAPTEPRTTRKTRKMVPLTYWDKRKRGGAEICAMLLHVVKNGFLEDVASFFSADVGISLRFQDFVPGQGALVETTDEVARVQWFRRQSSMEAPPEGKSIETHWSLIESQPCADVCLSHCFAHCKFH